MSCPKEHRRYCGVPVEDEPKMVWSELISNRPKRFQEGDTHFMVKYDGRLDKPACLEDYNDYSYPEAKAIGLDPESPWYDPGPDY